MNDELQLIDCRTTAAILLHQSKIYGQPSSHNTTRLIPDLSHGAEYWYLFTADGQAAARLTKAEMAKALGLIQTPKPVVIF